MRDPYGFRPLVLGRLPLAAGRRRTTGLWPATTRASAGASRPRRPPSTSSAPSTCATSSPARWSSSSSGQAPRSVRFARGDAGAVRLRADLLRPPELVHGGPQPVRGPPQDGRCSSRRSTRRRRPGHARARHRRAGGGRLRRGVRACRTARACPQPLRRPDVHPAVAGAAPAGRHDQAQPAARGRPRQAADGRRRLDRARHDDQADRRAAAQGRRRPRSTSGSARRRSSTRASTASTPRSRPS